MALIKCPECGAEISDKSIQCIKCGCPINDPRSKAIIRFEQVAAICAKCTVVCNGQTYTCRQGESLEIPLSEPASVSIHVGGSLNDINGTISPGQKYQVKTGGFFGAKYMMTAY